MTFRDPAMQWPAHPPRRVVSSISRTIGSKTNIQYTLECGHRGDMTRVWDSPVLKIVECGTCSKLEGKPRTEVERVVNANALLMVIGTTGRRFFYSKKKERYAYLFIKNNRVWLVDEYTGKEIYTHYPHRWRGFNGGGTLKYLVCELRDYIKTGKKIWPQRFGPWPKECRGGDLWGYGDSMEIVRQAARDLGIVEVQDER